MRQCARCGELLNEGVRFCPRCGAEQSYAPTEPPRPQYQPPQIAYRPKNYLVESIIVTILCCVPVGIAAIVYAAQVDSFVDKGDYRAAQEASNKAKNFAILSVVLGVVLMVVTFVVIIASAPVR